MASGPITRLEDLIVPELYTKYLVLDTERKVNIIQSGALVSDPLIASFLRGGGSTIHIPAFRALDNDDDLVVSDTIPASYTGGTADPDPLKTGTIQEIAVRLARARNWANADINNILTAEDPMGVMIGQLGNYWSERLQKIVLATMAGVFADNDAAPSGTEHTAGDLTNDISGSSYVAGVTTFSSDAFIDTCGLLGDSADSLRLLLVHSDVYRRMEKNNLIDFVPDSQQGEPIKLFRNARVIIDDSMPKTGNVYDSWLLGAGALRYSMVSGSYSNNIFSERGGIEYERKAGAGNGGGADVIYSRVQICVHPVGHKYAGSASAGGPSNAATSNNLAHAGSWQRVYPERKQIKIARLRTREA